LPKIKVERNVILFRKYEHETEECDSHFA
jgi:hypothetical protein